MPGRGGAASGGVAGPCRQVGPAAAARTRISGRRRRTARARVSSAASPSSGSSSPPAPGFNHDRNERECPGQVVRCGWGWERERATSVRRSPSIARTRWSRAGSATDLHQRPAARRCARAPMRGGASPVWPSLLLREPRSVRSGARQAAQVAALVTVGATWWATGRWIARPGGGRPRPCRICALLRARARAYVNMVDELHGCQGLSVALR